MCRWLQKASHACWGPSEGVTGALHSPQPHPWQKRRWTKIPLRTPENVLETQSVSTRVRVTDGDWPPTGHSVLTRLPHSGHSERGLTCGPGTALAAASVHRALTESGVKRQVRRVTCHCTSVMPTGIKDLNMQRRRGHYPWNWLWFIKINGGFHVSGLLVFPLAVTLSLKSIELLSYFMVHKVNLEYSFHQHEIKTDCGETILAEKAASAGFPLVQWE